MLKIGIHCQLSMLAQEQPHRAAKKVHFNTVLVDKAFYVKCHIQFNRLFTGYHEGCLSVYCPNSC